MAQVRPICYLKSSDPPGKRNHMLVPEASTLQRPLFSYPYMEYPPHTSLALTNALDSLPERTLWSGSDYAFESYLSISFPTIHQ